MRNDKKEENNYKETRPYTNTFHCALSYTYILPTPPLLRTIPFLSCKKICIKNIFAFKRIFPQRANHSFTLLAEKNSEVSRCLSQFENILEFLCFSPSFLHSYINVDLFWKSAWSAHFKVFEILFFLFFFLHFIWLSSCLKCGITRMYLFILVTSKCMSMSHCFYTLYLASPFKEKKIGEIIRITITSWMT